MSLYRQTAVHSHTARLCCSRASGVPQAGPVAPSLSLEARRHPWAWSTPADRCRHHCVSAWCHHCSVSKPLVVDLQPQRLFCAADWESCFPEADVMA